MFRSFLFAASFLVAAGCKSPPSQADPDKAREALRDALDAWKRGESLDGYRQANPSVTVADRQWQQGTKLIDYEMNSEPGTSGYDAQFTVKLSLQDAAGKIASQKATYVVSTDPKIVVLRSEGGG